MTRRLLLLLLVLSLGILPAQQKQKSGASSTKSATRKSADTKSSSGPVPGSVTPPKDAVETSPGIWRHVDADGTVWLYRRTPFGWAKYQPEPEEAPLGVDLVATEDGDSVRFERRSPFGLSKWTRKKSELNDEEKAAWDRVSAAKASRKSVDPAAAKAAVKE